MNALNIPKRSNSIHESFDFSNFTFPVYACMHARVCFNVCATLHIRHKFASFVWSLVCIILNSFNLALACYSTQFISIQFNSVLITAFVLCIWNFGYFMQLFYMRWTKENEFMYTIRLLDLCGEEESLQISCHSGLIYLQRLTRWNAWTPEHFYCWTKEPQKWCAFCMCCTLTYWKQSFISK